MPLDDHALYAVLGVTPDAAQAQIGHAYRHLVCTRPWRTRPGRTPRLIDLVAQLPATVLAYLLNLHPTTAARWTRQAGSDWTRTQPN